MPQFVPNGKIKKIQMSHPLHLIGNTVLHFPHAPKLTVEVQEGRTEGSILTVPPRVVQEIGTLILLLALEAAKKEEKEVAADILAKATGNFISMFETRQSGNSYRIVDSSLPSYASLVDWARYDISLKASLAPHDMESALDNFLDGYSQRGPVKDLVSKDAFMT